MAEHTGTENRTDHSEEMELLGQAEVTEAEKLKRTFVGLGITLQLAHNPGTCSSGGCRLTVEVWARRADLPAIQKVFADQRAKLMDGLDFDPQVINQVYDVSKDQAVCPACGTSFATSLRECPECGLVFGIPEGAEAE